MGQEWQGYVTWRDLSQHADNEAQARSLMEQRLMLKIERTETRVNDIEAVLDKLAGAKALIYTLIGTNVLAAVAVLLGILR